MKPLILRALLLGLTLLGTQARAADEPDASPDAFVRVLHAIPGGQKVDIYIDGKKTLNDITFGALTKYLRVPAGRRRFAVLGQNSSRPLFESRHQLGRNRFYTLSAWNEPTRPYFSVLDETLGAQHPTRARIFAYNLSPGSRPFSVVAIRPNGRVIPLMRPIRYGTVRIALVPPGPATIQLRVNGRPYKTITDAEPQAGRRYTLHAIGRPGVTGDQAFRAMLDVAASQ
ncbi:MAG TPA: DUF4397 domain-containing protein [Abditibacteriaceae bacterium]|jgi:hypothetical protein